jgi:hypothetical protein
LADPAQKHQRRGAGRSHPSSTDPQRNGEGRDPEDQWNKPYGELAGAQREQRRPLDDQPPERCALTQPQHTGELGNRAVAHVERDRLLVEPERDPTLPLVDVQPGDDHSDRQRGSDVVIARQVSCG